MPKPSSTTTDYSLVLTDMRMPDGSGLEVVQYIDELMLDTPAAGITAFGNADHAVEALKAGAFDLSAKTHHPLATALIGEIGGESERAGSRRSRQTCRCGACT